MLLFVEAQHLCHDASGIEDPNMYWWDFSNGILYPVKQIEESEFHEAIRTWLDREKLPAQSLDDIPMDTFTYSQRIVRDWFMNTFYKMY